MASKRLKTTVSQAGCLACESVADKGFAVIVAVTMGHVDCLLRVLDAGGDVNFNPRLIAGPFSGCPATPLMLALQIPRDETECIVGTLIKGGADVNIKDDNLDTALTLAIKNGKFNFVKPLVEAGADVRYQGWNMLWHLAEREETARLKTLLQIGFSVNLAEVLIERPLFSFPRASMKINHGGPNVLTKYLATFGKRAKREVEMLLYEVGESLDNCKVEIPDYLQQAPSLKHLCREAIRKHLLQMDPHGNLFHRVPKLEIPLTLHNYLLYDQILDDGDDDDDAEMDQELEVKQEVQLNLKHLCRKAIREHLLRISDMQLFVTVPTLGLPLNITDYLLYEQTLDDDDDDD